MTLSDEERIRQFLLYLLNELTWPPPPPPVLIEEDINEDLDDGDIRAPGG
jgi:hypothetical protein